MLEPRFNTNLKEPCLNLFVLPPCKDSNARFITVPLNPYLTRSVKNRRFSDLKNVYIFEFFHCLVKAGNTHI